MKNGVNPLRSSHIECIGPCDRGERHYDECALAGRSAIAVAVVGLQSGSRVPQRCRAYRWQYSAGEAYERIGVDCDHVFPRSRSASDSGPRVTTPTVELVGAAAAVTVTVTKTVPLLQA